MKKRALTLIEIMIVIFLITLITGAIGYNMKGSLSKGKKMRTEQGIMQLRDLLLFCHEEQGVEMETLAKNPSHYLEKSGIAKDPKKIVLDGWGKKLDIEVTPDGKDFLITSKNL